MKPDPKAALNALKSRARNWAHRLGQIGLLSLTIAITTLSGAYAQEWAEAEVRRIDAPGKRVTLRHGEIKSLDMPPMTMVFHVDDAALLDGLSPGDTVRVQVIKQGRQYRVTALEKLR